MDDMALATVAAPPSSCCLHASSFTLERFAFRCEIARAKVRSPRGLGIRKKCVFFELNFTSIFDIKISSIDPFLTSQDAVPDFRLNVNPLTTFCSTNHEATVAAPLSSPRFHSHEASSIESPRYLSLSLLERRFARRGAFEFRKCAYFWISILPLLLTLKPSLTKSISIDPNSEYGTVAYVAGLRPALRAQYHARTPAPQISLTSLKINQGDQRQYRTLSH